MVDWSVYTEKNETEWDNHLCNLNYSTYHQKYSWGEYKSRSGWGVIRCTVNKNDRVHAMAQCFYKKYMFGFVFVLCPGGPVGDISLINKEFFNFLKITIQAKILYVRLRLYAPYTLERKLILLEKEWKRPVFKYSEGWTMLLNIHNKDWIRNLRRGWKRNLKRFDNSTTLKIINPIIAEDIYTLYKKVEQNKKLKQQFSKMQFNHIINMNSKNIIAIEGRDSNDELIGIRAAIIFNNKAWDLFAATSSSGREKYVSYAIFVALVESLKSKNIECYDLSGIHPLHNSGVYNFKNGTGADLHEYMGEFDMASNKIIRLVANMYIWIVKK